MKAENSFNGGCLIAGSLRTSSLGVTPIMNIILRFSPPSCAAAPSVS